MDLTTKQYRPAGAKKTLLFMAAGRGKISGEELPIAVRQIKSKESIIDRQILWLDEYKHEPEPMDTAAFKKLIRFLKV